MTEEHADSDAQYLRIGETWECQLCGTEGRGGAFGIIVHELWHKMGGGADD